MQRLVLRGVVALVLAVGLAGCMHNGRSMGTSDAALDGAAARPGSGVRRQQYEWSPLHWAVRYNDGDTARELARGRRLEARDELGRTPLHIAAMFGLEEMVTLLLERGADPNARDQWGVTPLYRLELVQRFRGWDLHAIKEQLQAAGGVKKDMRGLRE